MRMSMDNMVIQLAERKMLTIRDTRDIRIECNEGMVWLTVEGQAGDLLLGKGEHLLIRSNGPAFIQGMPYGLVKLASAAPSGRQTSLFARPVDLHALHPVA
jgi:hypothetical protein